MDTATITITLVRSSIGIDAQLKAEGSIAHPGFESDVKIAAEILNDLLPLMFGHKSTDAAAEALSKLAMMGLVGALRQVIDETLDSQDDKTDSPSILENFTMPNLEEDAQTPIPPEFLDFFKKKDEDES